MAWGSNAQMPGLRHPEINKERIVTPHLPTMISDQKFKTSVIALMSVNCVFFALLLFILAFATIKGLKAVRHFEHLGRWAGAMKKDYRAVVGNAVSNAFGNASERIEDAKENAVEFAKRERDQFEDWLSATLAHRRNGG